MNSKKLAEMRAIGYVFDEEYDRVAAIQDKLDEASRVKKAKEQKTSEPISSKNNIGPGNPSTAVISAKFYFVNFLKDDYAAFSEYMTYFKTNLANVYDVKHRLLLNGSLQEIKIDFKYFVASEIPSTKEPNDFYIIVTNDSDRRPYTDYQLQTATMGYKFRGNAAAHEVGHLFGLSDRYHYIGLAHFNPGQIIVENAGTDTDPMNLPASVDSQYYRKKSNMMSDALGTFTDMQWSIFFSNRAETRYTIVTYYVQFAGTVSKPVFNRTAYIKNTVWIGLEGYYIDVNRVPDLTILHSDYGYAFILNGGTKLLQPKLNSDETDMYDYNIIQQTPKGPMVVFPNRKLILNSQQ